MSLSKPSHKIQEDIKKSARDHPDILSLAYGSRFATEGIPKFKIPSSSSSGEAVYRVIKDELSLDGKGPQNMATFLTTWMEPEVEELIKENLFKNLADTDEYPQLGEINDRCITMISNLFNAPEGSHSTGTSTTGSSEAVMLCCLSHKFNWRKKRKEEGKIFQNPNMVFGSNAHVSIEKFCRYFDVEPRIVQVSEKTRYVMDPEQAISMVDENTICVTSILGSTYTGHIEKVEQLNDRLEKLQKEKGFFVPIHVDAASGGFVIPFVFPDEKWDFRLKHVLSINVSGHKYGLVYPGIGWAIWKNEINLPSDLIFHLHYLGGDTPTFNLNFSRSSFQVIGQYYNFLRLGIEGYTKIMSNCVSMAKFLSVCLEKTGFFKIHSDIHLKGNAALPLVVFSLKDKGLDYDEYDIMRTVKQSGWIIPAYPLPPSEQETVILRIVIKEQHSEEMIENLVRDVIKAINQLNQQTRKIRNKETGDVKGSMKKHHTFSSIC